MKYFLILAILAIWILLVSTVGLPAVGRWVSSDSKLAVFEGRIAGVAYEFMRRSERLRVLHARLQLCADTGPSCNSDPLLRERDKIVKSEWPQVFDRLVIRDDWGGNPDTARARDGFFAALKKHGKETLRDRCVPVISFRFTNYQGRLVLYNFEGFSCSQ